MMHEVRIEPSLSDSLGQLAEQTILCDPSGRALGFFSPLPGRPRVDELQLEPLLSIAETEALREVQSGKPLSEIFSRLGIA
jgi:hypothetical protein